MYFEKCKKEPQDLTLCEGRNLLTYFNHEILSYPEIYKSGLKAAVQASEA